MRAPGLLQSNATFWSLLARLADLLCIISTHALVSIAYTGGFTHLQLTATVVAVLLFDFLGHSVGLSNTVRGEPLLAETGRVLGVWMAVASGLGGLAFVSKTSEDFSRVVTLGWLLSAPLAIALWRMTVRTGLRHFRRRGFNSRRVAIVGATDTGARLAREIEGSPWMGMKLAGFYDDRADERYEAACAEFAPHSGDLDALVAAARKGEFDLLYIALPLRAEPRILQMLRRLSDTTVTVYMAADFYTYNLLHARWSAVGTVPVVGVHETPFLGAAGMAKRAQDVVLGLAILFIIALPMGCIALAVKLTSRGPVLFRQRRYGLHGEVIPVLKFRSMTVCEDGDDILQAQQDDQRFTPIGAFLRRTSLDELPQFLNVLAGHMSIVGPRPHAVAHNELYRSQISGYMLRHKVKPGITGWAQVHGCRGETDTLEKMERRVRYDLEYIRNWSLTLDMRIIMQTVFSAGSRKNAY